MFKTKAGRIITYNGKEYTKDIKKISNDYHNINSMEELFHNLLEVWCKETAYPDCQNDYLKEDNPTYGQCAITATLVHNLFGGTIHKIKVKDGITHYFNKINGHYFDLTSDQFDMPLEYEPNQEISHNYWEEDEDTLKRFQLLSELVKKNTNN